VTVSAKEAIKASQLVILDTAKIVAWPHTGMGVPDFDDHDLAEALEDIEAGSLGRIAIFL
jgi:hypothetical protein